MRKRIGSVGVDSGLMYVGDPCYIVGADSTIMRKTPTWDEFYKAYLDHDDRVSIVAPVTAEASLGIAVSSGYGDGVYPVYADFGADGVIRRLTIEFVKR